MFLCKTKNLKQKDELITHKCAKSCITMVQLYEKIVHQNLGLYIRYLQKFKNNAIITPSYGKKQCFQNRKCHKTIKIKIKSPILTKDQQSDKYIK